MILLCEIVFCIVIILVITAFFTLVKRKLLGSIYIYRLQESNGDISKNSMYAFADNLKQGQR